METTQSDRVQEIIHGMCKGDRAGLARFELVKAEAALVIDKSNGFTTSHGNAKIAGLGDFVGRLVAMVRGTGKLDGEWTVAEVLVKSGHVLVFDRPEAEVLEALERLRAVEEVMRS